MRLSLAKRAAIAVGTPSDPAPKPSASATPSPKPSPITLPITADLACGATYSTPGDVPVPGSFDVTGPEAFTFTLTDAYAYPLPACPAGSQPGATYTVTSEPGMVTR